MGNEYAERSEATGTGSGSDIRRDGHAPLQQLNEPDRGALARELERLEADAVHAADAHGRAAKRWRAFQVVGGALTALLAASAGITGITETVHPTLAGVKALLAAALGAAMTAMEPSRRAEEARTAYARYLALHHRAHRLRKLDLPVWSSVDTRKVVEELAEAHDALGVEAPPVPLRKRQTDDAPP